MAYTGAVRPGGDPDVRELSRLTITKVAVNEGMSNNCYILRCRATGERLLIDAADEGARLLELAGPEVATVVTTHRHSDHHQALREVVLATGATTVAGIRDAASITEQTGVRIDRPVGEGDTVTVGDAVLRVVPISGHTPGSICLRYDDPDGHPHLFTGDCLFPGGPGRTATPEEFTSLMDDLETAIFNRLPDETWFYPGHGDDSTLGAERGSIPQWRSRGW